MAGGRAIRGKVDHNALRTLARRAWRVLALGALSVCATAAFRCDLAESDWHFDAIDSMLTPADPPLRCDVDVPAAARIEDRQACAYKAGSRTTEVLGIPRELAATLPIRHVVIVMKENRTFDHLLGKLHAYGQSDTEAVPATFRNLDADGREVAMHDASTTCYPDDPDHQSDAMKAGIDSGRMDGFVRAAEESTSTNGHFVMGQYGPDELPFYYWLASTYALADRHFAPMASGTYANRNFLLFGSNAGVVDTYLSFPNPETPSVFRTLMDAGYTWGAYTDSNPMSGALAWDSGDPGVHPISEFYAALDAGALPNVSFVDGEEDVEDDHPTADVQVGEAWLRRLYTHAVASPQWSRMALIWTYDEGGGFADHVKPPSACPANGGADDFTQLGPRVPLVFVSPWAKRHYVSHLVHDHTAILRFVEMLFDLPALTSRDANSDALLDLFDFSCANGDSPIASPPKAGTGGCRAGS